MAVLQPHPSCRPSSRTRPPGIHGTITKLLGVEDVANIIGFTPSEVYELLRTGQIKAMKRGKAWRVRPSAIEAFL